MLLLVIRETERNRNNHGLHIIYDNKNTNFDIHLILIQFLYCIQFLFSFFSFFSLPFSSQIVQFFGLSERVTRHASCQDDFDISGDSVAVDNLVQGRTVCIYHSYVLEIEFENNKININKIPIS